MEHRLNEASTSRDQLAWEVSELRAKLEQSESDSGQKQILRDELEEQLSQLEEKYSALEQEYGQAL